MLAGHRRWQAILEHELDLVLEQADRAAHAVDRIHRTGGLELELEALAVDGHLETNLM